MTRKSQIRPLIGGLVMLLAAALSQAQITPSSDAYTDTANPTTNFGNLATLDVVSGTQTTYIQFDLSSAPAGYTSANLTKATLRLYVNAVTATGSFNVNFVNGTWSEKTITANTAPSLGATIASNVSLPKTNVHDYVLIDITSAVGAWLDGTQPNDGIALVANSPLNASFDSKENTTNSQPAELDLVLEGNGTGTITGVTTASGSGLIGGTSSGTANLSLVRSCSTTQVLQWNGSGWACSSAGSGTVTSVNTPAGSGLSGGPITSSGSLSIAPAGVTNAMLANPSLTISPGTGLTSSSGGSVSLGGSTTLSVDTTKVPLLGSANSFNGNQNIAGNLNASGLVGIGTTSPGAELDVFSSTAGVHTPMAQFGSKGTGDSNSTLIYNGTGVTEMFQAGFPNAFVTGTVAGDGGLRVKPGNSIFFGDNSGRQRMVINGGPDVVISSGAPTVIGNPVCGRGAFGGIGFGSGSMSNCTNYSLLGDTLNTYLNRPTGGQIVFRENNNTEMVLASGGNVGIGTPTPSFLLHVNGVARAENGLSLGGNASLIVDAPGIIGGHFTVQPNGNVGINNPNPQHTLDVNGSVSINGDTPMTSNPHMTFAAFLPSLNLANCGDPACDFGQPFASFVPDKSISITRVDIALATAVDPSCSPLPEIVIVDNGVIFDQIPVFTSVLTIDQAGGVPSIHAGDQVTVSIVPQTIFCGGGASPGSTAYVNVEYVHL